MIRVSEICFCSFTIVSKKKLSYIFYFTLLLIVISGFQVKAGEVNSDEYSNPKVDSLLLQLEKNIPDSLKLKIVMEIAWELAPDQPDRSIKYGREALLITAKINSEIKSAEVFNIIGEALLNKGEFKQSILEHEKALEIFRKINNQRGIANSLNKLGQVYFSLAAYKKSIEYIDQALQIFKAKNPQKPKF